MVTCLCCNGRVQKDVLGMNIVEYVQRTVVTWRFTMGSGEWLSMGFFTDMKECCGGWLEVLEWALANGYQD